VSVATQVLPSAAILLTGLSGSGKTTLGRALVRRLTEEGLQDVLLLDGEELRARLSRPYGHSLAEREAVWREILRHAQAGLAAGKVVVIATIAHRLSMRTDARLRLRPYFEVHLDCSAETCAGRDVKGQYRRALAGEYDCFIGVTHEYERSGAVELRLDTAALPADAAEAVLVEKVLGFLSTPLETRPTLPLAERFMRWLLERTVDSPLHWRRPEQRRQELLKNAPRSKAVVHMERRSCAQLVFCYGGLDAFLGSQGMVSGMSPLEFMRLSGLFGRNLTWIRDPYGDDFMRGTGPDIADAQALAAWTRDYAQSLPQVREVHAIGYSSGSYGALMFGHLCRMQSVWAFSPRTSRVEQAERAKAELAEMLSVHNGVTRYQIWFASGNRRDRAFAERLAGCPGVTLHPSEEGGSRHFLIRYMAENGALRTILPAFLPATPGSR